jgi:hypothetical protein
MNFRRWRNPRGRERLQAGPECATDFGPIRHQEHQQDCQQHKDNRPAGSSHKKRLIERQINGKHV